MYTYIKTYLSMYIYRERGIGAPCRTRPCTRQRSPGSPCPARSCPPPDLQRTHEHLDERMSNTRMQAKEDFILNLIVES